MRDRAWWLVILAAILALSLLSAFAVGQLSDAIVKAAGSCAGGVR